jgi:hypothetical protein
MRKDVMIILWDTWCHTTELVEYEFYALAYVNGTLRLMELETEYEGEEYEED